MAQALTLFSFFILAKENAVLIQPFQSAVGKHNLEEFTVLNQHCKSCWAQTYSTDVTITI